MIANSTGSSCPTSSVTAANTSWEGTPRATKVATRRNAACSSATWASSARLSAFAIAVASSSVNEARRASTSGGSTCPSSEPMTVTPHRRPSTTIGVPIDERMPRSRAASADRPGSVAIAVDAGRKTGPGDNRADVFTPEWQTGTNWQDATPPRDRDECDGVVELVASQMCELDVK